MKLTDTRLIIFLVGFGLLLLCKTEGLAAISSTEAAENEAPVIETPFGVNNPYSDWDNEPEVLSKHRAAITGELKDLGICWVSDSVFRKRIETLNNHRNGEIFSSLPAYDKLVTTDFRVYDILVEAYKNAGVKILFVINPKTNWQIKEIVENKSTKYELEKKPTLPKTEIDYQYYEEYLKKLINRYVNKVDMWEIYNEPADEYRIRGVKPSHVGERVYDVDNYVKLVEKSYSIIRNNDSKVRVVLGGVATQGWLDFYEQVLDKLQGRCNNTGCFDVFDYHTYEWNFCNYDKVYSKKRRITKTHEDYYRLLNKHGFGDKQIISKEGGTFTGKVNYDNTSAFQTEAEQSEFLVKRAVHLLSKRIHIINWSTVREHSAFHKECDSFFNFIGLIYDGTEDNCNDSYDPGSGIKKLSYYTYKLLIEKLKGSNFDEVNPINSGIPNVYLFEFIKQGKTIYVAWLDYFGKGESGEKKHVTLTVSKINASKVKVTKAIPHLGHQFQTKENKLQEENYSNFFESSFEPVIDRKVTIILGKEPVYIEETAQSMEKKLP